MPVATFSLNGNTYHAQLPDGFLSASPADQQKTLEAIQSQIAQSSPHRGAFDDLGQALQQGAHDVGAGLSSTASTLAGDVGQNNLAGKLLDGTANVINAATPNAPTGYQGSGFEQDFKAGNYGAALSDLPRAAAQGLPSIAANVLAGSAAGPGGIVAYNTAQGFGQDAAARAAANGDATPTPGDQIGGALTAAGTGALQAAGLGELPGVGAALDKVPTAVGRVLAKSAAEGLGAAGANVAQQAGTTAGTKQGLTIDPAQAAQAGVMGAAARGVQSAGASMLGGVQDAAAGASAGDIASLPQEQQNSIQRVADLVNQVRSAKGSSAPPTAIFNSVKEQIRADLKNQFRTMRDNGMITQQQYSSIASPLVETAARHNHELIEGNDATAQTVLDRLPDLGLPSDIEAKVRSTAMDLQTLSEAARQNRQTGPLQRIGEKAGTIAAIPAMLAVPHTSALLDIAAGGAARHAAAKIGGKVGAVGDSLLGLREPKVMLQARAIAKARAKSGDPAAPVGSTYGNVNAIAQFAQNPDLAARQAVGLSAEPEAVNASEQARQANQAAAIRRYETDLKTNGLNTPVGSTAADQLRVLGASHLVGPALEYFDSMQPRANAQAAQADAQAAKTANDRAASASARASAKQAQQMDAARFKQAQQSNAQAVKDEATVAGLRAAEARSNATAAFTPSPGEALLNKAAERNQATLDASDMVPNTENPTGLTAQTAAMNDIGKAASRIRRAGGEEVAPPVEDVAPQSAPAQAPQGQPATLATGSLPTGWRKYVMGGLLAHQLVPSMDHIDGAVNDLVQHGKIAPDFGEALLNHTGPIPNVALLEAIKAQAAHRMGADALLTPLQQAQQGAAMPATEVRDPVKYRVGAERRQATFDRAAAQLRAEGKVEAAQAVMDARHKSEAGDRKAVFDGLPSAALRADIYSKIGKDLYGGKPKK